SAQPSASARPSASAAAVTAVAAPPNAPLVVQVENSQFARPQSGLAGAAHVAEYVADGGNSRSPAIYSAPPASVVGPVRSARLATIELLRLYGAVLMYSGGSHYINGLLSSSGLPHYDETAAGGDLFRINSRSAPRNLYTEGAQLR